MKKSINLFMLSVFLLSIFAQCLTAGAALPVPLPAGSVTVNIPNIASGIPAPGFTYGGTWTDSGLGEGGSLYSPTNPTNEWCQWQPTDLEDNSQVMERGMYDIYFYNVYRPDQWDTAVKFDIASVIDEIELKNTIYIDQKTASGGVHGWVKIASAYLGGDGLDYVKMSRGLPGPSTIMQSSKMMFVPREAYSNNLAAVSAAAVTTDGEKQYLANYLNGNIIDITIPKNYYKTTNQGTATAASVKYPVNGVNLKFIYSSASNYTITCGSESIQNQPLTYLIDSQALASVATGISNYKTVTARDDLTGETKSYTLRLHKEGEPVIIDDYCPGGTGNNPLYEITSTGVSTSNTVAAAPEVLAMECSHADANHKWWHRHGGNVTSKITLNNNLIQDAGFYEVWVWNSRQNTTSDNVLTTLGISMNFNGISHFKTTRYDVVPQRWTKVGTYYLNADGTETISLSNGSDQTGTITFRSPAFKLVPVGTDSSQNILDSINIKVGTSVINYTLDELQAADFTVKLPYYTSVFSLIPYSMSNEALTINDAPAILNGVNQLDYTDNMNIKLGIGGTVYNINLEKEAPPASFAVYPANFGLGNSTKRDGSIGGWTALNDGTSLFGGGMRTELVGVTPAASKIYIPENANYKIWARVKDQNDGAARSYTIKIENTATVVCTTPKPSELQATLTWYWDSIPRSGYMSLSKGWHTIEVSNPGVQHTRLDGIVFVKEGTSFDTAISAASLTSLSDTAAPVYQAGNVSYFAAGNTSIKIENWPAAEDSQLVEYQIFRKTGLEDYAKIAAVSSTQERSYLDTKLASGTEYTYFIRAYDAYGQYADTIEFSQSTTGAVDNTAPTWPAGSKITVERTGHTDMGISWTEAADNIEVSGYNIYKNSVAPENLLATSGDAYCVISGLTANSQTNIVIEAFDTSGNKTAATISKVLETLLQFYITPQHENTLDSHVSTSAGFSKSQNAKGYNNNDTLYAGTLGCYVQWIPNITKAGYYNIRLYKPVYNADGIASAEITIVAGGKTYTVTKDWKTGASDWVDFGSYYFNASQIGNQYIQIKKVVNETATLRADSAEFSYIEVDDNDSTLTSLIIDKEQITDISNLKLIKPDYITSVSFVPVAKNKDAVINVNGVSYSTGDTVTVLNDKKMQVINITVYCGNSTTSYIVPLTKQIIIDERDSEVTPDIVTENAPNAWINSSLSGSYGSSAYTNTSNLPLRYPINQKGSVTVRGRTEVWVYNVISTEEASKQDSAVGVRIKAHHNEPELATFDQTTATGTPGWIKIGTYDFTGLTNGSEYVEIYRQTSHTATVRAAEVMFVNADPIYIDAVILKKDGAETDAISGAGSYSGSVICYNLGEITESFDLVFALYDSQGQRLDSLTAESCEVEPNTGKVTLNTKGIALTSQQAEEFSYRIFVLDSINTLKPLY